MQFAAVVGAVLLAIGRHVVSHEAESCDPVLVLVEPATASGTVNIRGDRRLGDGGGGWGGGWEWGGGTLHYQ